MSGRAHPVVYVLTVLVALNLAATLWIAFTTQKHTEIEIGGGRGLPTIFSSSARDQLFEDFRLHYNNKNYDAIFDGFDASTRLQIDREQLDDVLLNLHKTWGVINEGAYSHYKFLNKDAGREWFDLFFVVKVVGGELGKNNTQLKFTLVFESNRFGVTGFSMGDF